MSSEERFKRLVEEGLMHEGALKAKRNMERATIASSKLIKIHLPSIDKVCRDFSKGIGWEYYRRSDEDVIEAIQDNRYSEFLISYQHINDSYKFAVKIYAEKVHVQYRIWFRGRLNTEPDPRYSREIPLDELTEEKLAQAFEDVYKMVYQISDTNIRDENFLSFIGSKFKI